MGRGLEGVKVGGEVAEDSGVEAHVLSCQH